MDTVVEAPQTQADEANLAPDAGCPPAKAKPWRLRHPKTARTVLYGAFAVVGAVGWLVASRVREDARQQGLLTRIHGVEMTIRPASPELALQILRDEVLARDPSEDVRRRALLAEAASLDAAKRFDEAEAAYRRIEADWPSERPLGALILPWANMRVRAGRTQEALALLDAKGATEGETPEDVKSVRDAAESPIAPFAMKDSRR